MRISDCSSYVCSSDLTAQKFGLPFTTPDQPTNGSVAANIADLEIWGIELETSVSPVRDVTVSFNGAYTHESVKSLGQVSFGPGVPPPVATKAQVNLPDRKSTRLNSSH